MKLVKILLIYALVSLYFFLKPQDGKIPLSFEKIFPSSALENFYESISNKFDDLKKLNHQADCNSYFSELIDSILDFHIYIHMLRQDPRKNHNFFKDDMANLLYFIKLLNNNIEKSFKEDSNKIVTKVLLDKAVTRLSALT